MTLRHLKIFVAVYQTQSITRAAEKLYMSQPSVSIAIKELENYYNQPIYERLYRKLLITPFGQELYQYAIRIVSLFDEMDVMACSSSFSNIVRIGAGTTVGQVMLPTLIREFKLDYPEADINVMVDKVSFLKQALAENNIDFAVAESLKEDVSLKVLASISTPLVAVCHKDNELAKKPVVTAKDLATQPLLARQKGSYTRSAMDKFFEEHGITATPKWESVDGLALLNAAKENIGISFLALNHVQSIGDPNLVTLNVEDFSAEYRYSIFTHRDKLLNPLMEELVKRIILLQQSMFL